MKTVRSLLATLALLAQGVPPAAGQEAAPSPAARYFTDVVLVDQDGKPRRFYSDLLAGKIVVINTIFTTCTGMCPAVSKTFARIQDRVGDRLGRDVHLISISVDPVNDTPEKLKAFAQAFGARPGWYFLTGEEDNVRLALYKLGQQVEDKEAHKAILLVGNEPTGLWKKAFALAPASEVIAIVESVLADQGP